MFWLNMSICSLFLMRSAVLKMDKAMIDTRKRRLTETVTGSG
jgi:hypothetical protein